MTHLSLENIDSFYGTSHILHNVSLEVEEGSLVTLIGRNGVGKTTTLKTVMGMVEPRAGVITFDGDRIDGESSTEISRRGISLIPEHRRIFSDLTARENIRMGHLKHETEIDPEKLITDVFDYFPRLEERVNQPAGQMSGGEQQMLAIARALVSEPDLLLVDEPTEGLMPELVGKIKEVLVKINNGGMSILLVEQNVDLALSISDYAYVLDEGIIQTEGPATEIRNDPEVKTKYLTV